MAFTHAVIFTGGDSPNLKVLAHLVDDALVIAADSGYAHAQSLGLQPPPSGWRHGFHCSV